MEKPPRDELKFQPITEGLGFHPFSDGLPYAPVSRKAAGSASAPRDSGVGAISAGMPTFIAPRLHVPVAQQQKLQSQVQETAPVAVEAEASLGLNYLVRRICAYVLDGMLNLAFALAALSFGIWQENLSPELLFSPGALLLGVVFVAAFNWATILAQEIAFGTSVGKRVFGLAIDGGVAALFFRAFFFIPSLAFGGLGVFWALIDQRRRCWHDRISGVQPLEVRRY